MIVYGDRAVVVDTAACIAAVSGEHPPTSGLSGLAWHQACFERFLRLAGLLQGWADAEAEAAGVDDGSPAQSIMMSALVSLAEALDRSWSTAFAEQTAPDLSRLAVLSTLGFPPTLSVRLCEGYAYYAVYPELYLTAARSLPAGSVVVGLRSIGTGLAALVAAASKARIAVTLRPRGAPFARQVVVGPNLKAEMVRDPNALVVIVDEGPGLSGSSFGGTADWLEAHGVDPARIVFMPSHGQGLGPEASASHRRRWEERPRLLASFEEVMIGPSSGMPLARWFDDLTGPPEQPLQDLSGGAWRRLSPHPHAPSDPQREARKYRLTAARGVFLLKFIGLGAAADGKVERARRLHEAGFGIEPLAVRYGFLLERWHAPGRTPERRDIVPRLGDYLAFRASNFPATHACAPLSDLMAMAARNLSEATGEDAASLFGEWPAERLAMLQGAVRPVHVDARLHAWEWLWTDEGLKKTDAVDHAEAHDIVGSQDIAWDVAGAIVEFGLTGDEQGQLIDRVMAGRAEAEPLVRFMTLCYLGFQLGWWSLAAGDTANEALKDRYRSKVRALIAGR